jgi:hypothetical protein
MMDAGKRIKSRVQTAVMLALLIGVQFGTRSFGQFVTGSLVNLILLVSAFLVGTGAGLAVAALSPFLAFGVGIGPAFIQIVPFIAVGNVIFVLIAQIVKNRIAYSGTKDAFITASGLAAASIAKTLFLWVGLVIIALPMIPGINEKQMAVISASFTWPQLVTALIGSVLAMALVPMLKRALKM